MDGTLLAFFLPTAYTVIWSFLLVLMPYFMFVKKSHDRFAVCFVTFTYVTVQVLVLITGEWSWR